MAGFEGQQGGTEPRGVAVDSHPVSRQGTPHRTTASVGDVECEEDQSLGDPSRKGNPALTLEYVPSDTDSGSSATDERLRESRTCGDEGVGGIAVGVGCQGTALSTISVGSGLKHVRIDAGVQQSGVRAKVQGASRLECPPGGELGQRYGLRKLEKLEKQMQAVEVQYHGKVLQYIDANGTAASTAA